MLEIFIFCICVSHIFLNKTQNMMQFATHTYIFKFSLKGSTSIIHKMFLSSLSITLSVNILCHLSFCVHLGNGNVLFYCLKSAKKM